MNGFKWCAVALLAAALSGCGSQRIDYVPTSSHFNDRQQAADVVEQTFYEDFGKKFRPQSVFINEKVIVLSDGVISESTGYASAVPIGAGAIAAGSSKSVTKDANRRIYLNSIHDIAIYQRRGRASRFTVVIRGSSNQELGSVRMGSLERAQQFSDAVAYLKVSSKP